jgi:hypothetical protein
MAAEDNVIVEHGPRAESCAGWPDVGGEPLAQAR